MAKYFQIENQTIKVILFLQPIIHIGLCMPASCQDHELFHATQNYFNHQQIAMQQLLQIDMEIFATKSLDFDTVLITSTAFQLSW